MVRLVTFLVAFAATSVLGETSDTVSFGSNSVGTMSLMPHLSATKITAEDIQNATTGTLTSKVNPGTLIGWTLRSGRWRFLLFLDVLYTEVRAPDSKNVDDRATGLGSGGLGIGYHFADEKLSATLFHTYTQTLFIRGKSETVLALDKVTIPEVGIQFRSIPVKTGNFSLGLEADTRVAFSVSSTNVEHRNGWGFGGKAFAQISLDSDVSLETGPYGSYQKNNTQLVNQTRVELGWLAGVTWTFN